MRAVPYAILGSVVCATVTLARPTLAEEALDPTTLKAALKTTVIEDDNYIQFLVTLVDQGRLSRPVFHTSFRWAREKSYLKFQFFKRAVIANADRAGVTLPEQTPPFQQTIQGKVVQRVLLVDVPVPYADVQIVGTSYKTKTDVHGEFSFADVPWGIYTVEADGGVLQLLRKVAAQVKLPYLPNDATSLTLRFR